MPAPSPYFNPDDFEFEVVGFVEDFSDADSFKSLGSRPIETPDRPLGSPGRKTYQLTTKLELVKGLNQIPVTVKPNRNVTAMLIPICGKKKARV